MGDPVMNGVNVTGFFINIDVDSELDAIFTTAALGHKFTYGMALLCDLGADAIRHQKQRISGFLCDTFQGR
jgi:hypothetical protein